MYTIINTKAQTLPKVPLNESSVYSNGMYMYVLYVHIAGSFCWGKLLYKPASKEEPQCLYEKYHNEILTPDSTYRKWQW